MVDPGVRHPGVAGVVAADTLHGMTRRHFTLTALAAGAGAAGPVRAAEGGAPPATLDAAVEAVAPELKKWASVCVVTPGAEGGPEFAWHDYRDTGRATDFWPASTIKLYAVVAALELLHERGFSLDATVSFEHREASGRWVLDCARGVREMLSETFRRSSNEDYTLLLRLVGIDRINTRFLVPEKGFERSALMRGYVTGRPWAYVREEPQRVRLRSADGLLSDVHEHTWSGRHYAEERGCTVIDAKTGNVTTPRDLVECLRRVLYHERIPESERYRMSGEQIRFVRRGGDGLTGLETRGEASGPSAWTGAVETTFPQARFFHKCGLISNYALEVAAVDDSAQGGPSFLMAPVVAAGSSARPDSGEVLVGRLARGIAEWVKSRGGAPGVSVPD